MNMRLWTVALTFLFAVTFSVSGLAQSGRRSAQEPQTASVSLCSLVAHPEEFTGKKVTLTAVLASSEDFSIFLDDSCPPRVNLATNKSDLVNAAFNQSQYDFKSRINKKLAKMLRKEHQAKVTVIGFFTDPGHYFGGQGCCRYQLDIQKLVSIGKVSKSSAIARTNYR